MADTIPVAQLRAFVERIERIEADIKDLNGDKSEVYKELRGRGFDVKAVRAVVAKRKLDTADREERDAMFDLYWSALNGTGTEDATRVHVHGASYSEAKGRGDRCGTCDGTGDVHRVDGEWMGYCYCEAGKALEGRSPNETGELTDNQENQHDADSGQHFGRADGEQRDAARVSSAIGHREGDDEGVEGQGGGVRGTPAHSRGQPGAGPAGEPRVEHCADQDRGSRHVGGEAHHEVTAQDDVGATASSTYSAHKPAGDLAADKGDKDWGSRPVGGPAYSNSPGIPLAKANSAGEAPSSQASPANLSDPYDPYDPGEIPAFLRRAEGGHPKREAEAV